MTPQEEKYNIKVIDWYFPLNCEEFMDITIELNGYRFNGVLDQIKKKE